MRLARIRPHDRRMPVARGVSDGTSPAERSFGRGRIYKLSLDGKLLGMLGQSGKQLKQFGWIHALACPSENVLWVGELLNWRAQKLILHP
jgi:hypothetical protein